MLLFSLLDPVLASKPVVFVSIAPQKYFVQQISGGLVEVEVMVQPGASPATYEPKPSQMAKLSTSAAYFSIGVPFEARWLERISGVNEKMRVIHTDKGIKKVAMVDHHHEQDVHDEHSDAQDQSSKDMDNSDHTDHHEGLDPHIWLSPTLVKKQVATIIEGLQEILPQQKQLFVANGNTFLKTIDLLIGELHNAFLTKKNLEFMVFHPSWGYFAREFGLEQVPIELEGKSPKASQLTELVEHARREGIKTIFVQPQFSMKSARLIAREIGGKVFVADPLAEDWADNLRRMADQIEQVNP